MKKFILALLVALPLSTFAQKFGHYDSSAIIPNMPEYTAAQTEVQNMSKQYEDELKRMQTELQTKLEDYQKNEATMVDAVKQRRQQEMEDLNQRLQQYYQTSQQELNKVQGEKLQAIQAKVLQAIEEIGNAGGYVYIMDMSAGIPFISKTLSTDITAQLKTKLGLK
jgi:outer membrane protein